MCAAAAPWRLTVALPPMPACVCVHRTPDPLQGKIKSLEQVYLFSMAVKEYQIVDFFLGAALKDEVS